jgi:hypothetical protein
VTIKLVVVCQTSDGLPAKSLTVKPNSVPHEDSAGLVLGHGSLEHRGCQGYAKVSIYLLAKPAMSLANRFSRQCLKN